MTSILKPATLVEFRERTDQTQAALAQDLDWSPRTVRRYEAGHSMRKGHGIMLRAYMAAFGYQLVPARKEPQP